MWLALHWKNIIRRIVKNWKNNNNIYRDFHSISSFFTSLCSNPTYSLNNVLLEVKETCLSNNDHHHHCHQARIEHIESTYAFNIVEHDFVLTLWYTFHGFWTLSFFTVEAYKEGILSRWRNTHVLYYVQTILQGRVMR